MKRTKIVCTIGPASESEHTLSSLMNEGMNVARLNFSHGTHAWHRGVYRTIRKTAKAQKRMVAIMADLQGPKIRLGDMKEPRMLKRGGRLVLTTGLPSGDEVGVTYDNLHKDVKKGDRILVNDGTISLLATRIQGKKITCVVKEGGEISAHKGMNLPDTKLNQSSLTEKDIEDAVFATKLGADWVALSFVTSVEDIKKLRRILKGACKPEQVLPRIVIKIERPEALERFSELLKAADGVMIARGDLGVEIAPQRVPVFQKQLIQESRLAGKPVIVATQMLESMTHKPTATRAEVSDVANAVFDHADAVMLSGETATGEFPVEAVRLMRQIIEEAERSPFDDVPPSVERPQHREESVAHAIKVLAYSEHIDGVLSSTELAPWSETLMMAHPELPMYLVSGSETVARQNVLRWGVEPFVLRQVKEDTFLKRAVAWLLKEKRVKKGMRLAAVVGDKHGKGIGIINV